MTYIINPPKILLNIYHTNARFRLGKHAIFHFSTKACTLLPLLSYSENTKHEKVVKSLSNHKQSKKKSAEKDEAISLFGKKESGDKKSSDNKKDSGDKKSSDGKKASGDKKSSDGKKGSDDKKSSDGKKESGDKKSSDSKKGPGSKKRPGGKKGPGHGKKSPM